MKANPSLVRLGPPPPLLSSVCRDLLAPEGPTLASDGPTNYQIICPGMFCKLPALALITACRN